MELATTHCVRLLIAVLVVGLAAQPGLGNVAGAEGEWWAHPEIRACCAEADAVYADEWIIQQDGSVLATVTGSSPRTAVWAQVLVGKTYLVPASRVLEIPGNPTGRASLFLGPNVGQVFCFAYGPQI